ncbi:hypothetical protein Slala03_30880 [Streptomyces lavendulae subsp. lavendulae]|nr:hypothetical protein Slala03_30880 [Streptomyces lavendulae subsp. lavendulae]GLX34682.1 hypothetical protein Sros01_07550 [Streptomyces roseochromogenus]
MSSIAQAGILVSVGRQLTVEPGLKLGRKTREADGFCDRLDGRRKHSGYVIGSGRGQLAPPGTAGNRPARAVVLSGGSRSRYRCGPSGALAPGPAGRLTDP